MKNIISGQNLKLASDVFKIAINCTIESIDANDIDISAFLLDAAGKVSADNDFVFYNNPRIQSNCLELNSDNPGNQFFSIDLSKVPDHIKKIAFVATLPVHFSQLEKLSIGVENEFIFQPETQTIDEKSLILGELYLHQDSWKFRALGMGFKGGLAPLAISYGVDIDESDSASNTPQPSAETAPETVKNEPPTNAAIDLIKSTMNLNKQGEKATINLSKDSKITARLIWKTRSDLDLYCFYVDNNDKEDKVYYKNLGSLDNSPYIELMGDSQVAGEEIIEFSQPKNVKYALLAAYSALSNGIGSFYSYKARIVVRDSDNQEIVSHLAHRNPFSYWVAFALIDFTVAGKLSIKNVETYSNKKTFARQFQERTGSKPSGLFSKSKHDVRGVNSYDPEKSPHLFKDGSFMMSVGDREFK
jgi:stress response protein SCP2